MADWEGLVISILKQAKFDYIQALRERNHYQINELEKFFLSEYGEAMSRNQGDKIIALCKKIVDEERKKKRRK